MAPHRAISIPFLTRAFFIPKVVAYLVYQNSTLSSLTSVSPVTTSLLPSTTTQNTSVSNICGIECQVSIGAVNVFYWAVPSSNTACLGNTSYYEKRQEYTSSNMEPTEYSSITNTPGIAQNGEAHTVVGPDGFIYTSPYVYLVFPHISAIDYCGNVIGEQFTSVTISLAPGELSSGCDLRYFGTPAPFNFTNLPCPPASIAAADWYNYKPELGRPYLPDICPPQQILDLNPAFKSCDIYPGSCFDPPYALTPEAVLSPFTTPAFGGDSSLSSPTPLPRISSPGPTKTSIVPALTSSEPSMASSIAKPSLDTPATSLLVTASTPQVVQSQDLSLPSSSSQNSQSQQISPQGTATDPTGQNQLPPNSEVINAPTRHQTNTPDGANLLVLLSTENTDPPASGSLSSTNPAPVVIFNGQTISVDAPATTIAGDSVVYSASSIYVNGQAAPVSAPENQGSSPILIGGLSITALPPAPTSFAPIPDSIASGQSAAIFGTIGTNMLSLEGPPITVSNTVFSLGPAGLLIGGTKTVPLEYPLTFPIDGHINTSTPTLLSRPLVFTIAGQAFTFTPALTGLNINGQTLLPGKSPITINGNIISLGAANNGNSDIVIGTNTIPLWQPTDVVLGTSTLLPGSAPLTINTVPISMAADGNAIFVGTSRFLLSSAVPISLDAESSDIIIGTSTVALTPTSTAGLGDIILSAFGPARATSPTSTVTGINGTLQYYYSKGNTLNNAGYLRMLLGIVVLGIIMGI